ncbi:MAG: hypothetical protein ABSH13_13285 [Candidatus Acidiferrum sp.]
MIGYSAATLQRVNVLNVTPNGRHRTFWTSGAGPAADSKGHIYLLDGNGTFDNTLNPSGFPINGDFGNGFPELSVSREKLSVADSFKMYDTRRIQQG